MIELCDHPLLLIIRPPSRDCRYVDSNKFKFIGQSKSFDPTMRHSRRSPQAFGVLDVSSKCYRAESKASFGQNRLLEDSN